MATLLIIRKWVICPKCWRLQRLPQRPGTSAPANTHSTTLSEVKQLLNTARGSP